MEHVDYESFNMDDASSSQLSLTDQETEEERNAEEYDFENFSNEDQMDYLARHFPYVAAQVMQNDPEASEDALLFTSPESSNEALNRVHSQNDTYLLGLPSIDLGGCLNETNALNENEFEDSLQHHNVIGNEDISESEVLLDSLLATNTTDSVTDDDVYNFDINSEELQRFIEEFEAISKYEERLSKHKRKRHSKNRHGEKDKNCESSIDLEDGTTHKSKVKFSKTKQLKILVTNLLKSSKIYRTMESERKTESVPSKSDASPALKGEKSTTPPTCRTNNVNLKAEQQLGSVLDIESEDTSRTNIKHKKTLPVPHQENIGKQSNERLLVKATMNGELNKMKYLLDSSASQCNISDLRGNTLLHVAAKFGHLECLQYLLGRVCPDLLQRENNDCLTPTAVAVKHGQHICMEWLVTETSAVAELEVQDNRWSMLHIAARYGQEACLRWLLAYMQNEDLPLDVLDNKGNTPAHLAAKYGHLYCVQTLVEFNQDITLLNKKQQTPCALALKYGFSSCAQFLVVVEACSILSEQVVRLQREMREIEQENTVLKSRLDDAVACTDGLIQMQKTDLMKKVEEVRAEYQSLTSMLIKKLDMMHLQSKDKTSVNCSAQAKEKADMLGNVCDCLASEGSNRQSPEGSELQKIESTIQRIQEPYQRPLVAIQQQQPMNLLRNKLKEVSLQILKIQSAKTDEDKMVWGMKQKSENACLRNTQTPTQSSTQTSTQRSPSSTNPAVNQGSCDVGQRHANSDSGAPCHETRKHQSRAPFVQNVKEHDFATDKFYSGSSQKIEAKTASIVSFTGKPVHSPQSSGSSTSSLGVGPKVSKSEMRGERLRTYFSRRSKDEGDCKTFNGEIMPLDSDHDSISHELASQSNCNINKCTRNGNSNHTGASQSQDLTISPAISTSLKEVYKKSRPAPIVEKIENSTENLHRIFARHLPANKYNALKQMPDYLRKVQTTKPHHRKLIKIDVDGEMTLSTVVEENHALSHSDSSNSTRSSDALSTGNSHTRSGILTPPGENRKDRRKGKDRHITFAIDEKTHDLFTEQKHGVLDGHNGRNLFFSQKEQKEFKQRNTEMKATPDKSVDEQETLLTGSVQKSSCNFPPRKIRSNGQLSEDNLRIACGLSDKVGEFGDMDSHWNESISDEMQPRAWYDSSDEELERKCQEKHESYL